jgi:hypothetical protein
MLLLGSFRFYCGTAAVSEVRFQCVLRQKFAIHYSAFSQHSPMSSQVTRLTASALFEVQAYIAVRRKIILKHYLHIA